MSSTFDYKMIVAVVDGSVLRLTLNRPEAFNALDDQMVEELRDLFVTLYWRSDIRVVLMDARGRHFCAGLDLAERTGRLATTADALSGQRRIADIVVAMRRCPQPIIALIQGAASGGGFGIALAADVRIAGPDARMNAAFIRIGLSACDIGVSYFLPRMVGASVAAEYMLTGKFLTADRARELGLVSDIVAPDALMAAGETMADAMLHATSLGLRLTKEALGHAIDASALEAVIAMEDRNQVLCSQSEDFAEGIAAFKAKRRPGYADQLRPLVRSTPEAC